MEILTIWGCVNIYIYESDNPENVFVCITLGGWKFYYTLVVMDVFFDALLRCIKHTEYSIPPKASASFLRSIFGFSVLKNKLANCIRIAKQ